MMAIMMVMITMINMIMIWIKIMNVEYIWLNSLNAIRDCHLGQSSADNGFRQRAFCTSHLFLVLYLTLQSLSVKEYWDKKYRNCVKKTTTEEMHLRENIV